MYADCNCILHTRSTCSFQFIVWWTFCKIVILLETRTSRLEPIISYISITYQYSELIGMHLLPEPDENYTSFLHAEIFYPYGSDEGDEYVERGDDNNSTEIHLPQPFPFRSSREDTLYVCCMWYMKIDCYSFILNSPLRGGGDLGTLLYMML